MNDAVLLIIFLIIITFDVFLIYILKKNKITKKKDDDFLMLEIFILELSLFGLWTHSVDVILISLMVLTFIIIYFMGLLSHSDIFKNRLSYPILTISLFIFNLIVLYSVVYQALYDKNTASFTVTGDINPITFLYFSFATFTTTGYGDIQPLLTVPRLLSMSEMLSGWITASITIGLILAHYSNKATNE